jgi:Mg-chelatase subunit ChlD
MKSKLLGITLVVATVATVAFYPAVKGRAGSDPIAGNSVQAARKIEVVFVLDTTSSMSGLIETAKEKIWSIASTMANADPAPEIRMGLVAFRDRGDDYVTRVVDLSPDLDSIYATLMQLTAQGGGDGPESVNQALNDAVERISWTQDPDTYRVVFLVGDAPPHMDYNDDVRYPQTLAAAARRGIVVNSIQCGDVPTTVEPWTEIARLGGGRYFQVEQAGGAVAVATPFDAELAELAAALDETRLYYGSQERRAAMESKLATTAEVTAAAPVAAQARRGVFNASASGAASFAGNNELIDDVANGRVDIDAIPAAELPEPLQSLDKAEQKAVVNETLERREALKRQIETLAKQRDDFISEAVADDAGAAGSLDRQIYEVVRDQAAAVGLSY